MKSSTVDLMNVWDLGYLSLERSMMKFSTLFECGPLPPMSTSCPPDVIHVTGVPRPSRFLRSSASVYYTERELKNKKWGRPGNEASL